MTHPSLRRLGYTALIALTVLAAVFYRERAIFTDMAFQTVLMSSEGAFQVMVNRFGVVLVQALPLSAIKLGLPLQAVSMLYSLSFPLLYLGIYAAIVRGFRNDYLGWALVLLFTLMVYDGFYWPSSEQQQGLAFLLLFFAFVQRYSDLKPGWTLAVAGVAVPVLAYYHPLIFIPFYFLWAFFLLRDSAYRNRRYIGLAGYMALVLAFKSKFSGNWYDDDKSRIFKENLLGLFPDYFSLPAHGQFAQWCVEYWYFLPIIWVGVTAFYMARRQWAPLLLMWAFGLGHLLLLHIASPEHPYRFYAEVNYMPLTLYAAIPFLYDMTPAVKRPQWLFAGLAVFLLLRIGAIALHHKPYTQRLQRLESILAEGHSRTGSSRLLLHETPALSDSLFITWSVPYETLLLSAIQHPDSAKTLLIRRDFSKFEKEIPQPGWLLSDFGTKPDTVLNRRYFRLPEGAYQYVRE
jgi:hypothetical protein